jgi:hypothetical protein
MIDNLSLAARYAVVGACLWLPRSRQKSVERWLRGREEFSKTRKADVILMSYGKSGRTWLRVMLSRFYQTAYDMPANRMFEFDNFKRLDPRIPSIYFTHGNYLRNYTGRWSDKADFYDKRILMLARDPRDIAVSQYFQWKHRMLPRKKMLNDYPEHGTDISVFDFVMDRAAGLPIILDFMEMWQRELPKVAESLVVRYEVMRAEPQREMKRILAFCGTPGSDEQIADSVDYAAYENMKRLETGGAYAGHGQRLVPGIRGNPDSFKVRRAKVGGYRDYFDDEQAAAIDALMAERQGPLFGYLPLAEDVPAAAPEGEDRSDTG